jgi:CHAD domain-containing protein
LLVLDLAEWANGTAGSARDEQAATVLAGPAVALANALLQRQYERLRKRGRHFRHHTPNQRHRLRLAAKKLRYALEFFASLYPRRAARAYLEALIELQDELGRYNDQITARTLVHHLIDHAGGARRTGLAYAAGLLVGWHAGDAQAHAKRQRRAWRAVRRLPPCWSPGDQA